MAVESNLKQVKVVLGFANTTQTIGRCSKQVSDANLYSFAQAVGSLNAEGLETVMRVEEIVLTDKVAE